MSRMLPLLSVLALTAGCEPADAALDAELDAEAPAAKAAPAATDAARASTVTVCHATGSASNPWVEVTVSASAWDKGNGHGGHSGDVLIPTWYTDADGDGYGDDASTVEACAQPAGTVEVGGDCNDGDALANVEGDEVCDGIDNDCDGVVDEADALDAATWYGDADGDGYGDAGAATVACDAPTGTVADASDCDDGDAAVNPSATELCDGLDNDCDTVVDEDDAVDASAWYLDADGDGFGDATDTLTACTAPSGYVGDASDCDDTAAATFPGADEVCDEADNDCDGSTDEDDVCCVPADFSLAFSETWSNGVAAPAPRWSLSTDGRTVIQSTNSEPAVYMTNLPAAGLSVTFNLQVQTTGDDDYIGWVVGFEPGDSAAPTSDWLLFDWKQRTQSYGGSTGRVGLTMSRVTGATDQWSELWAHTGDVTEIARANTQGYRGWTDGRVYTVEMAYSTTQIDVWVDGVLEFSETGVFPAGNFGFYTLSQPYGRFTLVDPTGNTCD